MKKRLIITLFTLPLYALDSSFFGGFDLSYNTIDREYQSSATIDLSNTGAHYTKPAVKLGVMLDDSHRIYATHKVSKGSGVDLKQSTLNYDYVAETFRRYRPYFGAHIGRLEYKEEATTSKSAVDDDGVIYGVQAGELIELSEHIELELGVSFSKSNLRGHGTYDGNDFSYEIKDTHSIFSGVNVKF
jgi:hypothetical protein